MFKQRGKGVSKMAYRRYTDEDRIKALELLALGNSLTSVSEMLGIPDATISDWSESNTKGSRQLKEELDKDFGDIRKKRKEKFINNCWNIIDKTISLLERKIQEELDKEEDCNKARVSELTTALGTLYDKQALASNEATQNITGSLTVEALIDKVKGEEY